ncbi:MAG: hypothetical protein CNE89_03215 [Sphingomonadaceae bacterium MED-G03]|jgi:AraC family transcriptional activator of pobA|nr:MAG: hypothetical protein CNE89_03215 [Sphingomonadaceae bacterium MED-G03]
MAVTENHLDFSPKMPGGNSVSAAAVPRYILYGDARDRSDWFVNVEPLDKRCRERGWIIKPHTHPRMTQIVYCQQGQGHMMIDGDNQAFAPGCVMVVPPHRIHGFHYAGAAQGWVITIETHYLDDLLIRAPELRHVLESGGVFPLAARCDAQVEPAMAALTEELQAGRRGGALGAEIQLMSVLLLFLRHWPVQDRPDAVLTGRAELVRRFRLLVEAQYRRQPRVSDLAAQLCVSVSQLRLACKSVTGMSPIELLHDHLLAEAKRCLAYTPMSVSEIAHRLGFSDAAYFSRFFAKLASMPPTAFRRQQLHPAAIEP